MANYLSDLTSWANKSDVTIFNSGSLRIDEVVPEGLMRQKVIM